MQTIIHEIPPVYNQSSRILILGSFPSVKSRAGAFFYHNPQNRFWKVLSAVLNHKLPTTIEEKKQMLLSHNIAIWDVIRSCTITGSSDSTIRDVIPNDFTRILSTTQIQAIYTNGATAHKLYQKHSQPQTNIPATKLPSTSPANAAFSLDRLIEHWQTITTPLSR